MNALVKKLNKLSLIGYHLSEINSNACCFTDFQNYKHFRYYRDHCKNNIRVNNVSFLNNSVCFSSWCSSYENVLERPNSVLCLSTFKSGYKIEVGLLKSFAPKISNYRSKSIKSQRPEYDSDSDSDVEEDLPRATKIATIRLQSLRLDGLLKKSLNIARNKVEVAFYEGSIRVNGKKPAKKSFQLRIGDEIDLIKGPSPMNSEFLNVSRVEIMSVKEGEDEDELLIKVKVSKTLYIENYQTHPWKYSSPVQ